MAMKLGSILGVFEEVDQREAQRNGRFLRIKMTLDLKKPLKRGTMVQFKEKNLRIHFKYEILLISCCVCGIIGHQMKDSDTIGDLNEQGFEELEERDLSYGAWLRASPLPRVQDEQRKKESNSSSCGRCLFNVSSGQSHCDSKGKEAKEDEVEQGKKKKTDAVAITETPKEKMVSSQGNVLEIEVVTESLSAVDISNTGNGADRSKNTLATKKKKWT